MSRSILREYMKGLIDKPKYYVLLTLNLSEDQESERRLLTDALDEAGWEKESGVYTTWSKSFTNNESRVGMAEKMVGAEARKNFESCLSKAGLESVNAYLQVGKHPPIQLIKK
ncbi:MAG: hypothetical protein IBX55_12140 [Methyloprofundus sp.]|nr:hypothetical protein [Methyloprofundus sp.]